MDNYTATIGTTARSIPSTLSNQKPAGGSAAVSRLITIIDKIDTISSRLSPVLLQHETPPATAPRPVESEILSFIDQVYFKLAMLEERISL